MIRTLSILLLLVIAGACVGHADDVRASTTGTISLAESKPARQPRPAWAPLRPFYESTNYRPVLHRALQSSDSGDRARSAFLLGMIGDRDSAAKIVGLLKDPDRTVRVSAGLALGFLRDERGIHVCEAVLRADPDWLRYYSIYALWYVDSPRAKSVLKRNLTGQDDLIAGVIRDALKTPFVAMKGSWTPAPPPSGESQASDFLSKVCDAVIEESDVWWHQGDYAQTIRCYEAAVFVDPTYLEGYSMIAWLQWSMGDDAAAIRTLNRGIKAMPEDPESYGALGQHYWLTKRYELALEPLRKSIELGGDHLVRRKYANTLEKLGKTDEALAQWEEILKEVPDDGAAPVNIERLKKVLSGH